MVHDTPSRQKARELKEKAHSLSKEGQILADIEGMEPEAEARQEKAKELREQARALQEKARLEDISVRRSPITKRNKEGEERVYERWICSWQEGDRIITKYLGSCAKMSQLEALQKAKRLKAEALGINDRGSTNSFQEG